MVKITMDHSALAIFDRDPVIRELKKLDEEKKITLYHAITLDRDIEHITESESEIYEKLREMVFGKEQKDMNLTEHGDLLLLMNHIKNKRDFFLTFDKGKYNNISKHRNVNIKVPDKKFLNEIKTRLSLSD